MAELENLYVGIDVGGTSVKVGLMTAAGELLGKSSVPTPPINDEAGYAAVVSGIRQACEGYGAVADQVLGIGLAVPCPVPEDGVLSIQANVQIDAPGLVAALNAAYPNAAVRLVNDANAAAMGELWAGAAQGRKSLVLVTIGTGIGGGVVVDGRVIAGAFGAAGELGHVCMNPAEERVCGCGGRGHLEQYSSATGVVSSYLIECEKRGIEPRPLEGTSDSRTVFQACREGDEAALAAMRTMADYLGRAFSLVANIVDPELIVLGGGASASADVYLDEVMERYRSYALPINANLPVEIASLGNDAGIFGAAYVALQAAAEREAC